MKMLAMLTDWLCVPDVDQVAADALRRRERAAEIRLKAALARLKADREAWDTRGHTPGAGRTLDDVLDQIDDTDAAIAEVLGASR